MTQLRLEPHAVRHDNADRDRALDPPAIAPHRAHGQLDMRAVELGHPCEALAPLEHALAHLALGVRQAASVGYLHAATESSRPHADHQFRVESRSGDAPPTHLGDAPVEVRRPHHHRRDLRQRAEQITRPSQLRFGDSLLRHVASHGDPVAGNTIRPGDRQDVEINRERRAVLRMRRQ